MTIDHKGTIHELKQGKTYAIQRRKLLGFVGEQYLIHPQWDGFFCDGCTMWWPKDKSIIHWSTATGVACDPVCLNCTEHPRNLSSHADGKCLFGPGHYEMNRYNLTVVE